MNIFIKYLRIFFMMTCKINFGSIHREQSFFYKLWAPLYDLTVNIDPGYSKGIKRMLHEAIRQGDMTLDVGCGTGQATIAAASLSKKITGIDPSAAMMSKLANKISKSKIKNVEIRKGLFPEVVEKDLLVDSIITSFAMVHMTPELRERITLSMFHHLKPEGRVGFFSGRGELLSVFESKAEFINNLEKAGFTDIKINDLYDVYRVVTAVKPNGGKDVRREI